MFGPERENVLSGRGRKLHNEEFHNLYTSPGRKPIRMRWAGYIARMVDMRKKCYSEILKEKGNLGNLGTDRRVILNGVFVCGLGSSGPGLGPMAGFRGYDNEHLVP